MSAYLRHLRCPRCGSVVSERDAFEGCPACRAQGVGANVHPAYDLSDTGSHLADPTQPGLFRYRDLLPLRPGVEVVSRGEGSTPLVQASTLGERVGVADLYVKDESANPTWSYKDRLAAVAVSKAVEMGAHAVVVATTGNHGAAAAAYAAAAGLRCVVLTLESVPLTMKVLMQMYGAQVVALERPPDRWKVMAETVREWGWVPISGYHDPPIGSNPFGLDGYKTIAYELVEQLGRVPAVVVVPAAYADGLAGIVRGFEDLLALGRIDAMPRTVAIDPLGAYEAALRDGSDAPPRLQARPSVAFSTATPIATFQGIDALRRTNGAAVAAGDDEILAGQRLGAETEGLFMEAAAAACIPAVQRLSERGWLEGAVVMVNTSTGLKDIDTPARTLPPVPVIEPDLGELDRALEGAAAR